MNLPDLSAADLLTLKGTLLKNLTISQFRAVARSLAKISWAKENADGTASPTIDTVLPDNYKP